MAKYQLQVPAKSASNLTVLAAKFDGDRPTRLKWFTEKGYNETPDDIEFTKTGGKKRVKKGGWVPVDINDFEPAPAPLKADQVKAPVAPAVTDPNAVVTAEGTDAKKNLNEGAAEPGDGGEGGDQDSKKSEGAKKGAADSKSDAKKS